MAAGEGFLLYCRTDFSVRKEACVRVNLVVAVAERVEVDASALRQGEAVAIVKAGSVEFGVDGFLLTSSLKKPQYYNLLINNIL